jgi:hypothetical protein
MHVISPVGRQQALRALRERITAYLNRKMEVRFRLGEKVGKRHGGEVNAPQQSHYPVQSYLLGEYQ